MQFSFLIHTIGVPSELLFRLKYFIECLTTFFKILHETIFSFIIIRWRQNIRKLIKYSLVWFEALTFPRSPTALRSLCLRLNSQLFNFDISQLQTWEVIFRIYICVLILKSFDLVFIIPWTLLVKLLSLDTIYTISFSSIYSLLRING